MVGGAVVHTRLLRVAVEGIGEVILTRRLRVVVVVVGEDLVILQGGTVISIVRGSPRGALLLEGIHRHTGADVVDEEEGDGRRRIHDLEAHRGVEVRGTIDNLRIAVFCY